MPAVNLVEPTKYAIINREIFGALYEDVCASVHLPPTDEGYGFLFGFRPDQSRVTLVCHDAEIVRVLAHMPPEMQSGLAVPDGTFPLQHPAWLDLPEAATLLTVPSQDGTL